MNSIANGDQFYSHSINKSPFIGLYRLRTMQPSCNCNRFLWISEGSPSLEWDIVGFELPLVPRATCGVVGLAENCRWNLGDSLPYINADAEPAESERVSETRQGAEWPWRLGNARSAGPLLLSTSLNYRSVISVLKTEQLYSSPSDRTTRKIKKHK